MPEKSIQRHHACIIHSHADQEWSERVQRTMMHLLRRSGQELTLCDDFLLETDSRPFETIDRALAKSKVALLLVSSNSMASEILICEPMHERLAAARAEGTQILWVSVDQCFAEEIAIHRYRAVLPTGHYLEAMTDEQAKEVLKKIGVMIREAVGSSAGSDRTSEQDVAPLIQDSAIGSGRKDTVIQHARVKTSKLLRGKCGWETESETVEVQRRSVELKDGVYLHLISIPAGELVMGRKHIVHLESFWMSQTTITQAQWQVIATMEPPLGKRWKTKLKANPSKFSGLSDSEMRPVEQVSWNNAIEFCRRLSACTGEHYTLPSESQWEYACRSGTTTTFATGDTISTDLANYQGGVPYHAGGPAGRSRGQTTVVGTFPANPWGLYDMHGNVMEWCLDHYQDGYKGVPADGSPRVVAEGKEDDLWRVLRGGAWSTPPRACRSANRSTYQRTYGNHATGLRVCLIPYGRVFSQDLFGS